MQIKQSVTYRTNFKNCSPIKTRVLIRTCDSAPETRKAMKSNDFMAFDDLACA
jgi:hypothetical protein